MNAIILAGGKNKRMAKDKAFLELGGKAIIEIIIEKFKLLFKEIIIVTNLSEGYKHLGVKIIKDTIPYCGPLGGLYSGLKKSKSSYNFVTGCDTPFLKISLIKHLVDNCRGSEVTIPKFDGFLEPLCAVYSKNCLEAMKEELGKHNFAIRSIFTKVRMRYIPKKKLLEFDPDLISFFNINTPKDIEKARGLFHKAIIDKKRFNT